MSDYRLEAASKVEWAERALRAETENARLREALETITRKDPRESGYRHIEIARAALETKKGPGD